jgi:choline dehydrogenase
MVDHLIVGAGTAGCVLAARLSEEPERSVLVLEAGPDYARPEDLPAPLRDSYAMPLGGWDWGMRALAGAERQVGFPVGKVVGGTSQTGGAGAWRPRASDFDAWAAQGLPDWRFADVAPYFNAVETDHDFGDREWHGDAGPIPVTRWDEQELLAPMRAWVQAVRDAGHPACEDMNAPDATGVGMNPLSTRGRERVSAAEAYLTSDVRSRANLELRSGVTVERIALEGGRAAGVIADGELIRAREVIVCAGTPLTPALLMRSGIGPAGALEAAGVQPLVDLAGVGTRVMDQPAVILFAVPAANGDGDGAAETDEPFLQVAARLPAFPGAAEDHAFYLCLFNRMPVEAPLKPLLRCERAHWLIVSDLAPASTGTIAITSADPAQPPVCDLRFYAEDGDLERMCSGVRAMWELAKHPALAEQFDRLALVTEKMIADDGRLEGLVRGRTVSRQPWGGCPMGPDPQTGAVVDAGCRIHGVAALRVVDASVVPVPLRAGGTLTAMMLGERIAHEIRAAA